MVERDIIIGENHRVGILRESRRRTARNQSLLPQSAHQGHVIKLSFGGVFGGRYESTRATPHVTPHRCAGNGREGMRTSAWRTKNRPVLTWAGVGGKLHEGWSGTTARMLHVRAPAGKI